MLPVDTGEHEASPAPFGRSPVAAVAVVAGVGRISVCGVGSGGSVAGVVSHSHVPAVGVRHLLDDAEAEPRPLRRRGVPALEDAVAVVRRDPGAVVGDIKTVLEIADHHGHVLTPVFDRIAEQVLDESFQPASVRLWRPIGSGVERRLRGRHVSPRLRCERCEVDRVAVLDVVARSRHEQEVLDELSHSVVSTKRSTHL